MASYNGLPLGFIFAMNPEANPKARQVNAYAGADGLEVIDHGSRGGRTVIEGVSYGATPPALSASEGAIRALQEDGGAYTLVDTLGKAWGRVILVEFRVVGRVYKVAGGGYARKYKAEFLHVS